MKGTNDERLSQTELSKLTCEQLQKLFTELSTLGAMRSMLDIAYAERISNALINATLSSNEGSEDNEDA